MIQVSFTSREAHTNGRLFVYFYDSILKARDYYPAPGLISPDLANWNQEKQGSWDATKRAFRSL